MCEGSRDAKLDVCGAGAQVILSAKSETFWCPDEHPSEPMLGNGPSMGEMSERFALTYADLNERDYHRLVDAIDAGRIPVVAGD